MKEIRLSHSNTSTNIQFKLTEQSHVELFLHKIGCSRSLRLAKVMMHKGIQKLQLNASKLQAGTYIYVLKANQQQMGFGRVIVS